MENIKNKPWYRAVKVVYFIGFIFVLLFTIKLVLDKNPIVYVNKISCIDGSTLIKKTNDLSYQSFLKEKECLGIKEFNKYERFLPIERSKESSTVDISLLVKMIGFILLDILVVVMLFWLLKRLFFYIVSGEKII